jgi:hypothetical protein
MSQQKVDTRFKKTNKIKGIIDKFKETKVKREKQRKDRIVRRGGQKSGGHQAISFS